MSNRRNQINYDPAQLAHEDVGACISEYRRCGFGAVKALVHLAGKLRLKNRRVYTLYYRDQTIGVDAEQQRSIAAGAVRVLDHLAAVHMDAANHCHRKAEEIRERQRQLCLPLEETGDAWLGSGMFAARLAA